MLARRSARATTVVLAGLHGHGRHHLANLHRLVAAGVVRIVGVCDPRPPAPDDADLVGDALWASDLETVVDATRPQITVLCTPIQTHVDLALCAARGGSHVLLEKPPAPSLAEFQRLADGLAAARATCQVGFQNLGSGAVGGLRALMADGVLGEVRGIGAAGLAVRDESYFDRAGWAGRRRVDGIDIVDGVLSNPFVHAASAAIRVADAEMPGAIAGIELELNRANPIESDDTSVARILTSSGVTITVAASLCATRAQEPVLTVHGTRGRATWWYKRDAVQLETGDSQRTLTFERTDLLVNLAEHLRRPDVDLIVPLGSTRAVTELVDAVRRAPDPHPIARDQRLTVGTSPTARWVVQGVDEAVRRSAAELSVFSEQGVPWAVPAGGDTAVALRVGPDAVATYQLAPVVELTQSPRPFLHPVRTRSGSIVSDCAPEDHRWHLGVGVAIQDVGGVNFWGGRTYVAGCGYEWRRDHGTVRHLSWVERVDGRLVHELAWMTPDHHCLLVERRSIIARPGVGWILDFAFDLRNVSGRPLELGSPGSHGREGGGYGGFFWRLPALPGRVEVYTEQAAGEHTVHGSIAPWLAWRHDTGAADGSFTLVAAAGDELSTGDPWFVRVEQYPGFGSALAWDRPVTLGLGESISRSVCVNVVDGTDRDPAALYDELRACHVGQ